MYIKANHFDYTGLLRGMEEHLELKDQPFDDAMVSNAFKHFEGRYKQVRDNQKLEEWQEKLVIEFLSSIQITCSYFADKAKSWGEETKEEDEYHVVLAKVLDTLVDCITGTNDDEMVDYLDYFLDRISMDGMSDVCTLTRDGNFILPNGATLEPEQFANFLRDWVEKHLSTQLEGIDGFLFNEINGNVLPQEYMKDITIMDIPGAKVKHGDTLITIPLILLEVHER